MKTIKAVSLEYLDYQYLLDLARRNRMTPQKLTAILLHRELSIIRSEERAGMIYTKLKPREKKTKPAPVKEGYRSTWRRPRTWTKAQYDNWILTGEMQGDDRLVEKSTTAT